MLVYLHWSIIKVEFYTILGIKLQSFTKEGWMRLKEELEQMKQTWGPLFFSEKSSKALYTLRPHNFPSLHDVYMWLSCIILQSDKVNSRRPQVRILGPNTDELCLDEWINSNVLNEVNKKEENHSLNGLIITQLAIFVSQNQGYVARHNCKLVCMLKITLPYRSEIMKAFLITYR